jgi:formylglycine-generating enzyme required for sulfatase activity
MGKTGLLGVLAGGAALVGCLLYALLSGRTGGEPPASPPGMRWIPGGEFTMGSDAPGSRPNERPPHRVRLDGFWIDETEVTNARFRAFVAATGYKTTAEIPPDAAAIRKQLPPGAPPPAREDLVPGSAVFTPTPGPVPLDDHSRWWRWQPGADWRHPKGPGSSIEGKDDHPVVQVSWDDATAYAEWAGKRLPSEAEWEYAARGGLEGKPYVWGDEPFSESKPQANIWQGDFPHRNLGRDGFAGTAPVKSFAPNGYGLYDMAGNVWEWCGDWYRPDTYGRRAGREVVNPAGPADSLDPREPQTPKRVVRGGSFLCSDCYCSGYRPSARMSTSPDTGLSHTGFRCVMTSEMWQHAAARGR